MTGLSSILQPLSFDTSRRKPPDVDQDQANHRRPTPHSALSSDSTSRLVTQPYNTTAQRVLPSAQHPPPQSRESDNVNPSQPKNHRLSIAALARDKTNTALANLSLRPKTSSTSLHSSSSSSSSLSKQASGSSPDKVTTDHTSASSSHSYTIAEKRPAQPTPINNSRQFVDQPLDPHINVQV